MAKKGGLGRGLDALFDDNHTEESNITELKINEIEPNRNQPRKTFDEEALKDLSESISQYGVIQPIAVRPNSNGTYLIIAGERRWRASRIAGLKTIPAVIKELSDSEVMEIALVENLQREDLNPVEEAEGYKILINDYKLTQEDVAKKVGKSRSAVANSVRLLNLPQDALEKLKNGEISQGHAKALLMLPENKIADALFLISKGATVREIEKLAKEKEDKPLKVKSRKPIFTEVTLALSENLGRKVEIKEGKNGKGFLQIEYFSEDDLISLAKDMGK